MNRNTAGALALLAAAAAALALSTAAPAAALPPSAAASTTVVATIQPMISISSSQDAGHPVVLSGLPNSISAAYPTANADFTVITNDVSGYTVTLKADTATMVPADTAANKDVIPIGALSVNSAAAAAGGTGAYTPLSAAAAVTLFAGTAHTAESGDKGNLSFKIAVPFVNSDIYRATLTYTATGR